MQFGVVVAHQVDDSISCNGQKWFVQTQQFAVSYRTTQYTTEDVASSFIAGQYAIGGEENQCTRMIGDDAQGGIHFCIVAIAGISKFGEMVNQRTERVDIID